MTEESQRAPQQPRRVDDHAGASANPEQHLMETHGLSIRLQGKEGTWGRAVWALVREDRGKVKTLAVFEGTRREAASHFFSFIHPNVTAAPAAPAHQPSDRRRGGDAGRPQGRPMGRR